MPNPNDVPFIWDMGAQYLKDRERALLEMSAYSQKLGEAVQSFRDKDSPEYKTLNKQFSSAKRSLRALQSEPYSIFGEATDEGLSGGAEKLISTIGKAEAGQRKNWQPVPGFHGHHQGSLNSFADPTSAMSANSQAETMKILADKGYHLGSRGDKFLWLSEGAHLGGSGWKGPYAHMPADGSRRPDAARFRQPTFSADINPKQAADLIAPKLQQQLGLNKLALLNPTEQQVRAAVSNQAQRLGINQVFGLEDLTAVKSNNKAFKESGFNATSLAKAVQQYQWANRLNGASRFLGALPVVGAAFDAGDTFAGTSQAIQGKTNGNKLAGALQAISGGAGLASLSPAAPLAIPLSLAAAGLAAAVQRRENLNNQANQPLYGTGRTAKVIPTPISQNRSKPIGNGQGGITKPMGVSIKSGQPLLSQNNLKWALKQLGLRR